MTLKARDIHRSSTFPSILDSYLDSGHLGKMESVDEAVTQAKKEKRVRRPVSVAELRETKAARKQRHLVSHHRLHRLRDRLSQQYAKLLTEKVQRQQQEMKQNQLKTKEKSNAQTPRGLTFQELVGSALKDHATFLKSLPKTRYHLIFELQRQLGQRKCIQGIREQEVFRSWVNQSKTEQLEKQLQQIELSSQSAPELKLKDLLKKKLDLLPKIPEIPLAESDDQQENHGAFSEREGEGRGGGAQVSSPVVHGKQTREEDESELRFPSVFLQEFQVPRFSSLRHNFSEAFGTNIVPVRDDEPLHKSKTASEIERKLRLMHGLTLFNAAQSRSLLIKSGLMPKNDEDDGIQDMMERVSPNRVLTKKHSCRTDPPLPDELLRDHTTPQSSQSIQEVINPQADPITSSQKVQEVCNNRGSNDKVPLSMEDILPSCISSGQIFDTKMWSNYT